MAGNNKTVGKLSIICTANECWLFTANDVSYGKAMGSVLSENSGCLIPPLSLLPSPSLFLALFQSKEERAALGWIQTHGTLHSRQALYQLNCTKATQFIPPFSSSHRAQNICYMCSTQCVAKCHMHIFTQCAEWIYTALSAQNSCHMYVLHCVCDLVPIHSQRKKSNKCTRVSILLNERAAALTRKWKLDHAGGEPIDRLDQPTSVQPNMYIYIHIGSMYDMSTV